MERRSSALKTYGRIEEIEERVRNAFYSSANTFLRLVAEGRYADAEDLLAREIGDDLNFVGVMWDTAEATDEYAMASGVVSVEDYDGALVFLEFEVEGSDGVGYYASVRVSVAVVAVDEY